jgi:hypothetical protein
VLLIAAAQIFTASQFVLEEWILENYAMEPLQVVGWEGIFGFSVTVIASIILYLGVGRTEAGRYGYFDAKEGWHQVLTHRAVAVSSIMIMISIGYAMFFHTFDFEANLNSTAGSTSSGSRLREPSPRQVDRRLIPAALCSSGLFHLA